MRILFIGDIFAKPGRRAVERSLPGLIKEEGLDFVVANGENAAGGFGITGEIAEELMGLGIDVVTSGNHVWTGKGINEYLAKTNRLIRPLNYPPGNPGLGFCTIKARNSEKVSCINLSGRVFMGSMDCPFRAVDEALEKLADETRIIIVDMHAEATSEKRAMGFHLDGKVSLVAGTHTHIQTADEEILPHGTAYITDVGMTGPHDSVIGVEKQIIIEKFLYQRKAKFEPAKDGIRLNAVMVDLDEGTGRASRIERINRPVDC